ncbi:HAD family hydrolase, partial [Thermus scotoductus]|uniref:HAD family hydrolase n=1 Tax=Thermus scotoductus TaxID=37636 RepID=UPI003F50D981
MVRLVFVDVDGTLVGKEGVPACVWPAVEALQSQGVRLSLITGRPGRGHAPAGGERRKRRFPKTSGSGTATWTCAGGKCRKT